MKEQENKEEEKKAKPSKNSLIRYEKYIGCINDGKLMQLKDVNKPFLSLFKIMPTEGEIEKYVKLQKKAGFPMLNQSHAAAGKRIDLEDIKKAEKNPGTLVTAEELNKMANFKP